VAQNMVFRYLQGILTRLTYFRPFLIFVNFYQKNGFLAIFVLKTPFMNERNQKINSKWNILDNKSVVYNINIDKQYMRAEQAESEGRFAAASL
jgi:hypothetical protein